MEWIEEHNALVARHTFRDFSACWAAMSQIALIAEKMDHHPTWTNTYNRLEVRLTTHSAGHTITDKDRAMAAAISRLFEAS
jgi:4a-hydroxytetrahydrobiopterin dehydratase